MGGIELPQLGEGRFQRSPHPPERSGPLLEELILENVERSAMEAKIGGHGLRIALHGSHAQHVSGSDLLKVALVRAYGHRDVEAGLPVTTDTTDTQFLIRLAFG